MVELALDMALSICFPFEFIVTIFNLSGLCLLRENRVPSPCFFVTTPEGAMSQDLERQTCCMRSQSHERLWPPLLKLKFGNDWLIKLVNAALAVAKNSIPVFNSNSRDSTPVPFWIFHFHQFQFQFWNWNWPHPCAQHFCFCLVHL